jgi:hypothetical protein
MHYDTMQFTNDRYFSERDFETGEKVWFFKSREGEFGPYSSEDLAKTSLLRHIVRCRRGNLDGGRSFWINYNHYGN